MGKGESKSIDPAVLVDELLELPLPERIKAVADDVRTRKDRFAVIDAGELAETLEVPQFPDGGWGQISYITKVTIEEHAEFESAIEDFAYFFLTGKVSARRFKELEGEFEKLAGQESLDFSFLTPKEREDAEKAINKEQLEGMMDNGLGGLASYTIEQGDIELSFEGDVEDDGSCFLLQTPYDKRDGNFTDLEGCVIDDNY